MRGRKSQRHAVSDFMEMEQQRGISISAAALEFELDGHHVTLLDTPGHQDFSEDTYRTLLAVDSVVMVLDAAKGIEPQTRKLFEVCRARGLPVLTFINKLDQPALDPFELLDQIERVLGIAAAPMNWPLGDGVDFAGVYDLETNAVLLYERGARGQRTEPVAVHDPKDAALEQMIGEARQRHLIDAVEMISGAGTRFDLEAYRAERQTPVFFGSALNDFGVDPFLRALLALAPSPAPRPSDIGLVQPTDPDFSGFVFKMQANMNPRHRDRVAFVRVCSGRLAKDMSAVNERLGTTIRLSRVYRFFGRDRETVPEAYPGDVIGLVNPGRLAIGDTLYWGRKLKYPPIPQFPAERFAYLRPADVRHKRFDEAVQQLEEEGLMQVFTPQTRLRHPIVGVVGSLQFDVIEARLQSEYRHPRRARNTAPCVGRWPIAAGPDETYSSLTTSGAYAAEGSATARDVILFESVWELRLRVEAIRDSSSGHDVTAGAGPGTSGPPLHPIGRDYVSTCRFRSRNPYRLHGTMLRSRRSCGASTGSSSAWRGRF